jgi:hypothetical protein
MSHVAFLRLDGELGTFDPLDPATMCWEDPPEPTRLRSEQEFLWTDPASWEPIPSRPASRVLFRSPDGCWIQYERRAGIMPTYAKGDPRRGRKYAELTLEESATWFEHRQRPMPDVLAKDIAARRHKKNGTAEGQEPAPLAETLRKLKRCPRQAEVVRYLWDRCEREAPLALIAKDVFKRREASYQRGKASVRRQLERTRDRLEGDGCPLRLVISANSASLKLAEMSH